MATRSMTRHVLTAAKRALICSSPSSASSSALRLRPLVAATNRHIGYFSSRGFSTRSTSSSLKDPNPNWSNRPPKETILLDGCDFEHWLVVMEKPEGDPTRDEIIDSYIKTLAAVVGSEEEARMKIYSVSTRHYFAFGALVSEELSYKLKELPRVRWVLPDSYLDVKNKDYGGEPFINGQAVPYDPKYHEEWVRNNARANERNRRNDRPRGDRRNFDRRREPQNAWNSAPNSGGPPGNVGSPSPGPNMSGGQPGNMGPPYSGPNMAGGPSGNMGRSNPGPMGGGHLGNMGPPPNMSGGAPSNMGGVPPNNYTQGGHVPPNNMGSMPPNNQYGNAPNYGGMPNQSGPPAAHHNYTQGSHVPPNSMGSMPPNNQYGNAPNYGGTPNQSGPPGSNSNQQNFAPTSHGGNPYHNQNVPGNFGPSSTGGSPYQNQN